ncbi:MAG: transketolase [Candidatus Levybacteria bacterium]|nr:transketolase [Candidatus Levybacteria bacterium]
MSDIPDLSQKAKLVRKWSMIATTEGGSGHPTSCLSAADLATVLFDRYFAYDLKDPLNYTNDRFVLSKGHAAPLLYTLFALSGAFPLDELKTLRKFGSRLEGHPTPHFPYTDAATGSLGQGLSVGAGLAYDIRAEIRNSKFEIRNSPKVYVLLGDGELAEGQVWEACNFSSYYKLDNLVAIADINRLGQSQETMFGHRLEEYERRFKAFGFETVVIDGHNFEEIVGAFDSAKQNRGGKPFAIIAKTYKGYGISFLKDNDNMHGKPLKKDDLEKALAELGQVDDRLRFALKKPKNVILASEAPYRLVQGEARPESPDVRDAGQARLAEARAKRASMTIETNYKLGEEIATREVYGQILAKLADTNLSIYALDGDVKNSTYSQDFLKHHPDRFIECFIAEQNMVGVAVGLSRLKRSPFVSTFAAFFTRAADQIRMAAIAKANIRFVGSHAGVSIGEDGASQMGLEDIAFFGTIPESVVLHPSDAVSAAKLIALLTKQPGISYLRTIRPKTPVLYENDEEFPIGGSKILRSAQDDKLTIVAAGITVHEALKAYETLKKAGISVRVVDCYSIKPIDSQTLHLCTSETLNPVVITVEDHFEHGGLGDFVLSAVSDTGAKVTKMAVGHISRSGTKDELLDDAGISANHIVATVKNLVK